MLARALVGVALLATLLVSAASQAQAQGPQPVGPNAVAAPAGWLVKTIDSVNDVGQDASISVRGNSLYISYYDSTNQDLRVASPASSGGNCGPNNSWTCQTVDSTGNVGLYTSIAMPSGTSQSSSGPGVAYSASSGELKFAEYACWPYPCHWNISTVLSLSNVFTAYSSAKYDTGGVPRIAFVGGFLSADLYYARRVGSGGTGCGSGPGFESGSAT